MNQDDQELTQSELDSWEESVRQSVFKDVRQKEAEWQQRNFCFAWIDPEPTFSSVGYSGWYFEYNPESEEIGFSDPKTPCRRILRFSLLGGGQIRVIETWKDSSIPEIESIWRESVHLRVTAHLAEGGIQILLGEFYGGPISEMNMAGVAFRRGHQAIAERVAATFRLIDSKKENFYALLDGTGGCGICGRTLQDEISKLCAIGPDCARRYGIPHNH